MLHKQAKNYLLKNAEISPCEIRFLVEYREFKIPTTQRDGNANVTIHSSLSF